VNITSSNFSSSCRNTNSGNAILADDAPADIHIATNAVHHGERQPSFLVLPVLPISSQKPG
jgi:predicted acyl esterase